MLNGKFVKTGVVAVAMTAAMSFSSLSSAALSNAGFESGDATGGNFYGAADWTVFENVFTNATDGPGFGPVSHDAGGTQSLTMYGPFFPGGASGAFQSTAVNAGDQVTLEAWAMNWVGDQLQNLAIVQLSFWDGANGTGNNLGSFEVTGDAFGTADVLLEVQDGAEVSDWSQMLVSAVAPAGTVSAQAFLLHIQTAEPCCAGGSIFYDDVSITTSAVPVPAAAWLFGSALLGLMGISRRAKR